MDITSTQNKFHIGDSLMPDNPGKQMKISKGKKGNYFALAYSKDGKWCLVSDEKYEGGGLVIFINGLDESGIKNLTDKSYLKIQKIIPRAVFADLKS